MKNRILLLLGVAPIFYLTSCGPGLLEGTVNSAAPASSSPSPSPYCFSQSCTTHPCIFLSFTPSGDLGGVSGADTTCNGCSKPSNVASAKALIVDGTNRVACTSGNCAMNGAAEHVDWPLSASTTYYRPDGTAIGVTTAAGIFSFPLSATMSTASNEFWTGLNTNWTTNNGETCSSWTSTAGDASVGRGDQTTSSAIDIYLQFCNRDYNVYLECVEQ